MNNCKRYQSKLRNMIIKQIGDIQASNYSYKKGVDFLTNQPRFELIDEDVIDSRSDELAYNYIHFGEIALKRADELIKKYNKKLG